MRVKFNPLLKFCCTWTVPAAESESIGLRPTLLYHGFCKRYLKSFIVGL